MLLSGRNYLFRIVPPRGRVNREQSRQLAGKLVDTIMQAPNPPKQRPKIKFDRGDLDFSIDVPNGTHYLRLKLRKDDLWNYKSSSSLCVSTRGWQYPLTPEAIRDSLDSHFNYSGVLKIAKIMHGEVAD